jgi:predicted type IV restriction endonuclease
MAFKKKISLAGKGKVLNQESTKVARVKRFAKGTKYFFGGKTWIVVEEFVSDNTEMRRVVSMDDGNEELLTMETLIKDAASNDFKML